MFECPLVVAWAVFIQYDLRLPVGQIHHLRLMRLVLRFLFLHHIKERPTEHAAEMMRINALHRDYVFAGFQLPDGIDIHFKAIVVVPPTDLVTISVCDLFAIEVDVRLIEDAGETDV